MYACEVCIRQEIFVFGSSGTQKKGTFGVAPTVKGAFKTILPVLAIWLIKFSKE